MRQGHRVAIIGDIGGHLDQLHAALVELGADPKTHTLPAGLAVVQVGDLIHRGPDSAGVVDLVDEIIRRQPAQWAQLLGNHEAQYLTKQPRFQWPEVLEPPAVRTIRRWWRKGQMRIAAAISSPEGEWLATHAGLTEGFWNRVLDQPSNAVYAARALNGLIRTSSAAALLHGGRMIDGAIDLGAGPIWAEAGAELVTSWLDHPTGLPFNQVHGHSTLVHWDEQAWLAPRRVAELAFIDFTKRHSSVPIGGYRVVGLDPGFGYRSAKPWAPLVLEEAELIQ